MRLKKCSCNQCLILKKRFWIVPLVFKPINIKVTEITSKPNSINIKHKLILSSFFKYLFEKLYNI